MSIFGHYIDSFLDKTINVESIYNNLSQKFENNFNELINNVYYFSLINDELRTLIEAYNEPLPLTDSYIKRLDDQNVIGYSPISIREVYIGDVSDLLRTIDPNVLRDTFYIRIFASLQKIRRYMNTYSLDNFNSLVESNPSNNYDVLSRFYLYNILEETAFKNYFNLCFDLFKVFDPEYNRRVSAISLILSHFLKYFFKQSNFPLRLIQNVQDEFINQSIILNNYKTFIDVNYQSISEYLYKFLFNNFLVIKSETDLFKNTCLNTIKNNIRDLWKNSADNYFSNKLINLVQLRLFLNIESLYNTYLTYKIVQETLYPKFAYNTDYLDIDLNFLDDTEQYIDSKLQDYLSENFSNHLETLQIYSMQFRTDPVFFLNSEIFLHYYFINDLIFDKEFIPLECLYDLTLTNRIQSIMKWILNSIHVKENLLPYILDFYYNVDDAILYKCAVLMVGNKLLEILFDYYDSADFYKFITNLFDIVLEEANDLYYLNTDLNNVVNATSSFFKTLSIYYLLTQNKLFKNIITDMSNQVQEIINDVSFTYDSISSCYTAYTKYQYKSLYYLLSNFYLSSKLSHYLHIVLNPLKLSENKIPFEI